MRKYTASVIAAGCLWGLMGLFTRTLAACGVDATGAIVLRCGIAALLFGATILVRDPKQFRIRLRDFWCFFGTGICSLLFFTYCYFQAITIMDLSTAAVLLYTAPSIVMVLSLLLFHERITAQKLVALVLAFAGCCLVSLVGGEHKLSAAGILYGLGAGFGYALYSIFARYALDRGYSSNTINFYSCLLTTIGAPVAAMDIMTAKVDKEIRNGANRAMNCDMANVNKTLDAVAAQQEAIKKLESAGQLDKLPEKIQETARLRMQNPELPLAQLAALFDPPISKSCLNHRIRKIMEEARKL